MRHMLRSSLFLVPLFACIAPESPPVAVSVSAAAGTYTELTNFGANPGAIKGFKYVPSPAPGPNAPLVVAMHACSQTAANYRDTGWEELADELGFYVLYPQQETGNNALRCFNWAGEFGDPTNLSRGEGENQSIINMINKIKADHSVDNGRVFVSGFSGGGAQTALMMATWPEVFAGAATFAGVGFHCTINFNQVSTCLSPGINKTPAQWGDHVRGVQPGYSGPWPKVQIWHGSADGTVAIMNQTELMEQWTNVHGIDQTEDATSQLDGHTRKEYKNSAGVTLVETVTVMGMGHGHPVDPTMCGRSSFYFPDANTCGVRRVAEFWGLTGGSMPTDTVNPMVTITTPTANAMVSGTVNIQVTATDNVGVTQVEFFIDGVSRSTDMSAPYAADWNATMAANGQHRIRAVARDAAGNQGQAEITVTVMGGQEDRTPPTVQITAPTDNAMVAGLVQIQANVTDNLGVSRVEFAADGQTLGEVTVAPYTYRWDTSGVTEGAHVLRVRAFDAANNQGEASVNITVTRPAGAFNETFSSGGPDMPGWQLGEWALDNVDHTGSANSQSLSANAAPNRSSVSKVAQVPLTVDAATPKLLYQRQLALEATQTGTARFELAIVSNNNRVVVDESEAQGREVLESNWTAREADLSNFAGQTVTLELVIFAEDTQGLGTSARVWVDDLVLSAGSAPDTTPPTVIIAAPAAGAVKGRFEVVANITDNVSVTQALFFFQGQGQDAPQLVGSDRVAPFTAPIDAATLPLGAGVFTVRAFDAAGNLGQATLEVIVEASPVVTPEPNQPQPEPVKLGNRRWGCNAGPEPVTGAAWLILMLLGLGWGRFGRTR